MAALTLSRAGKTYILAVVSVGFAILGSSLIDLASGRVPAQWLILAALTVMTGSFAIRVPSIRATVSVSESLVFASALLFGPAAATVTVALDGLIVTLGARDRNIYRTLFALGEPAISVWVSVQLFYAVADVTPLFRQPAEIDRLIGPLILLTTSYFLLNSWLTATAVWLETHVSPPHFLRAQLSHLSLNYSASLCLAVLLVQNTQAISLTAVAVLLLLLAISYVSSKTGMARIEEANAHLAELNKLYLSTVETLAMAIDAKDQTTHGHIRRVQRQAVALARALGVGDEREIKAIQVAALLHDLGKLAVPEHILNKPGALTAVEFEQIKTHASVGAKILSAIDFPYPVTPIVRHHHESWDGTGYPDGLKGQNIPVGARILSVVDCFDALTSDRPYRRRLSPQEALEILHSRRGTMYDPRVVDVFIRLTAAWRGDTAYGGLDEREGGTGLGLGVPPIADSPGGAICDTPFSEAYESTGRFGAATNVERMAESLANRLGPVAPEAVSVVYTYDPRSARLVGACVAPADHSSLKGIPITLGKRVTGWVGANQRAIVNADAALDLGELAETFSPPLRTCLSLPVVRSGVLVGVLSLYSPNAAGFSRDQIRAAELLVADAAAAGPEWVRPARARSIAGSPRSA